MKSRTAERRLANAHGGMSPFIKQSAPDMKNVISEKARQTIDKVSGGATQLVGTVGELGRRLSGNLRLPGLKSTTEESPRVPPGTTPGIESIADVDKARWPGPCEFSAWTMGLSVRTSLSRRI